MSTTTQQARTPETDRFEEREKIILARMVTER